MVGTVVTAATARFRRLMVETVEGSAVGSMAFAEALDMTAQKRLETAPNLTHNSQKTVALGAVIGSPLGNSS